MSSYTNQEKVEAYLGRALSDSEASILNDAVEYVSNQINAYTNRNWADIDEEIAEDAEPTSRLYDGNGTQELSTESFTALDSIELLDSEGDVYAEITSASDYILYPLNADYFTSIHLRSYKLPLGPSRVRVNAVFGTETVPGAVVMVTTQLASMFLNRSTVNTGKYKKESIEGYSRELFSNDEAKTQRDDLMCSLDHLRHFEL